MTPALSSAGRLHAPDVVMVLARWVVGAVFIYMGLSKAFHPVEFLKLVRQYNVFENHVLLNLVASALPWFELFCGLLLVVGIAVRGTAAMLLVMLVPFTLLVFLRAWAIREVNPQPFCAIKFDCGCGAGEVFICRKLAENSILILLAAALVFWRNTKLCLSYCLPVAR
jgi:uncharacterized membrane protein YphA (DoxX/SURF4 family)